MTRAALLCWVVLGVGCHTLGMVAQPSAASRRASAQGAYGRHQYQTCGRLYDEAAGLDGTDQGLTDYNAACCHALAGDRSLAFAALGRAADRGLDRPDDLTGDDDLRGLRADHRWAPLLERVRANQRAHAEGANPERRRLRDEDQPDRQGAPEAIDRSRVEPRDRQRRERVRALLAAGEIKVAEALNR